MDFDEGIDRKTLRSLRDRFMGINHQRWERARSALTYRQQMVLEILPLAFHLNLPEVQVHCHSAGPHPLRYVIEMDRRYFLLSFNGTEPGFIALDGQAALLECHARPEEGYLPVVFDPYAMADDPLLKVVCHTSEPGNVQVFYRVSGDVAHLWAVDELGGVFSWRQSYSSRRYLLVPLLRFLENLLERKQLRQLDNHAGPTGIKCYELTLIDGQWRAEVRPETDRQGVALSGLEDSLNRYLSD